MKKLLLLSASIVAVTALSNGASAVTTAQAEALKSNPNTIAQNLALAILEHNSKTNAATAAKVTEETSKIQAQLSTDLSNAQSQS